MSVPEEVDKSDYRKRLFSLTQVCRFFAVVFMPIFLKSRSISLEHVHATQNLLIKDMSKIDRRADFASALVSNDPLACSQVRHVEECFIFYPYISNSCLQYFETHAVALLTVIRTLPCTIKSLSLRNVPISSEFFMALRAMTNLESLALSSVVLSTEFLSLQSTIRLDLKSFSLVVCAVDMRLSSLAVMESFSTFLNLDSIRILKTDNPSFLAAVISRGETHHVEKLHMNRICFEHYSSITPLNCLAQMPHLLTLLIDHAMYSDTYDKLDLLPVTIPKLQNLRCPVYMAPCLIPGRPLKSIDIYSFPDREDDFSEPSDIISEPSDLLRLIKLSTVPIKKLHVPTFIYLESPREFWDAFPDLDELSLTLSELDATDTARHFNSSAIINH
jgi:hypothetical protein